MDELAVQSAKAAVFSGPAIVPSLYAADHGALAAAAQACVEAGARHLHIDLMDGRFVPRLGLSVEAIAAVAQAAPGVPLHVHLMAEKPGRFIDPVAKAGAASLSVHPDAVRYPHTVLDRIRTAGLAAGLALSPVIGPESLRYLAGHLDCVLVMMVDPGRPGQRPLPAMFDKLAAVRTALPEAAVFADGGLDLDTVPIARAAGADLLVCGASVFGDGPKHTLPQFEALL